MGGEGCGRTTGGGAGSIEKVRNRREGDGGGKCGFPKKRTVSYLRERGGGNVGMACVDIRKKTIRKCVTSKNHAQLEKETSLQRRRAIRRRYRRAGGAGGLKKGKKTPVTSGGKKRQGSVAGPCGGEVKVTGIT